MITKIVSAKYPSILAKIISKVCSLFLPIHLIQNPKLPFKNGGIRVQIGKKFQIFIEGPITINQTSGGTMNKNNSVSWSPIP